MEQIFDDDFELAISRGKVLVDFYSTTCQPCKALAPILEELDAAVGDVTFLKMDVGESWRTASDLGVASVPTLILFEDGVETARRVGVLPRVALEAWLV